MRLSSTPLSLLSLSTLLHSAVVAVDGRNSGNAARKEYGRDLDSHFFQEDVVARKLAENPVIGVKKMSDDEGEKFWPEYWYFDDEVTGEEDSLGRQNNKAYSMWANNSEPISFRASFPLHTDEQVDAPYLIGRYLPAPRDLLSPLVRRAFQCPSGTYSCSSINRPGSCCGTGETCQLIQDTGLGDVGCCPSGETCSGSVTTCSSGYTSCPNNSGGGCCIPGYQCVESGCKFTFSCTF